VLLVHGVQTTLRSERRYKHFNLLDQLLRKDFGPLVPQALPAKRAFGNLHPSFVEERRVALERYLQQCVAIPALAASSLFCQFVEADVNQGADFGQDEEALVHSLHRVCAKQGALLKKGRRVLSWKRRYFCLCDGELFYYYAAEIANPFQPLGVISMSARAESTAKTDSAQELGGLSTDVGAMTLGTAGSSSSSCQGAGGAKEGGNGASPSSSVIIEPVCTAENTLPHHFSFAVHTSTRTYQLAADSAKERDEWVRVLCACGAQLSASSNTVMPPSPGAAGLPLPVPTSPGGSANMAAADAPAEGGAAEAEGGGADSGAPSATASGHDMRGLLYKRASKVHIAQRSEAETGQARDWVARHFRLREADQTIVYFQNEDDAAQHARGIVPLAGYERVEHATPPTDNLPFAFRLTARDGSVDGGIVLAAPTEEERNSWLISLSSALAAARATRDAAAAAGDAGDKASTEEVSLDAKLASGRASSTSGSGRTSCGNAS